MSSVEPPDPLIMAAALHGYLEVIELFAPVNRKAYVI